MGVVYEVQTAEGDRFAAKVITEASDGASAQTTLRFVQDRQPPLRTLEVGADAATGHPHLVMELLVGADLATVVKRHGALEPRAAVRAMRQAILGVAAAHEKGVVHRDLKPANDATGHVHAVTTPRVVRKRTCEQGPTSFPRGF